MYNYFNLSTAAFLSEIMDGVTSWNNIFKVLKTCQSRILFPAKIFKNKGEMLSHIKEN